MISWHVEKISKGLGATVVLLGISERGLRLKSGKCEFEGCYATNARRL